MFEVYEPEIEFLRKDPGSRYYNVTINNRQFKDVPAKHKNECNDCEISDDCWWYKGYREGYNTFGTSIAEYDCKESRLHVHEHITRIWYNLSFICTLYWTYDCTFNHHFHIISFILIQTILFFVFYAAEKKSINKLYRNFINVLENYREEKNFYKEMSSIIKSKLQDSCNEEKPYNYMATLEKIQKLDLLLDDTTIKSSHIRNKLSEIIACLKHILYFSLLNNKISFITKISKDLQTLYDLIYYYKNIIESQYNTENSETTYFEEKIDNSLDNYLKELQDINKQIKTDFNKLANSLVQRVDNY